MKLLFIFAVLSDPFPVAAFLNARQYGACAADKCLQAVNVTSGGYGPDGTADCRRFMTSTAVVNPVLRMTTTTSVSTATFVPLCPVVPTRTNSPGIYARGPQAGGPWGYGPPRGHGAPAREEITTVPLVVTKPVTIPNYASSVCRPDQYSSACRCIGVAPVQVTTTGLTLETTLIVTHIETSLAPCTTAAPTSAIKLTYSDKTSTTTILVYDPITSGTNTGTGTGTSTGGSYHPPTSVLTSSSSSKDPSYSYIPPPPYGNTTTSSPHSYTAPTPPYSNRTTSSYGGIPTSDTTVPPLNSTLPPTNATTPPTALPPSNTSFPPSNSTLSPPFPTAGPTIITLPPFPIPTNSTLPPFPTSPANSSLPPFTFPSNSTLSPFPTSPPSNSTLPPFPTSPPNNTTLPPFPSSPPTNSTLLPPTNTTASISPTGPPTCGGRGVRLCSGVCTDMTISTAHCGTCNNTCLPGYLCTNGVCTRPACDSDCRFSRLCGASSANTTCACGTDTSGAGVCYNRSFNCSNSLPPRCESTAECPLRSVCMKNACCGASGGRCVSTDGCGTQGAGFVLGERVAFGGFAVDGEDGGVGGRSVRLF